MFYSVKFIVTKCISSVRSQFLCSHFKELAARVNSVAEEGSERPADRQ